MDGPTGMIANYAVNLGPLKEADESTADPEGRWFSFNITSTDYLIMERKTLPQHLQALENCDVPVTLQSLINDMEDLGEARCYKSSVHVGHANNDMCVF